ncbi:MAG: hypothetical protein ACRDST_09565 [Pseudonocardiaceae bacterium]
MTTMLLEPVDDDPTRSSTSRPAAGCSAPGWARDSASPDVDRQLSPLAIGAR